MYAQNAQDPSVEVDAKYRTVDRDRGIGQKNIEVIFPPWAVKVVIGAPVRKHQTLMTLSQQATANIVFSGLTARSATSDAVPRRVKISLPSSALQILIRWSSAP